MLNKTKFFIREHVGLLKLSDTYDILDPETQEFLGVAKEKVPAAVHVLRLFVQKTMLPTSVIVYQGGSAEAPGLLLFEIRRSFNLGFRTRIQIINSQGISLGYFQKKAFSLGGAFFVFDAQGQQVAKVSGNWKGWDFRFEDATGKALGQVTKKWAGFGKELFTTADNYIVSLEQSNPGLATLLLAAGLAIDTVFKER